MGLPCTFVRFAGCNLRCRWCDTPQSSWKPTGEEWALEALLARIAQNPGRTVVITGGEPFLQAGLGPLCIALKHAGHPIHFETAGTVFQDVEADLVCISPKLDNSAPDSLEFPDLYARHELIRFNAQAVASFLARWPERVYFKFVVEQENDLALVMDYLAKIGFADRSRVFLMPQCRTPSDLSAIAGLVATWCIREGFRYSDRLHVRLWRGEPGR